MVDVDISQTIRIFSDNTWSNYTILIQLEMQYLLQQFREPHFFEKKSILKSRTVHIFIAKGQHFKLEAWLEIHMFNFSFPNQLESRLINAAIRGAKT